VLYLRDGISILVPRVFVRFHYDKREGWGSIEMSWADFNILWQVLFAKNGNRAGNKLQGSRRVAGCGNVVSEDKVAKFGVKTY
jgi:hypothetical protein